MTPSKALFWFCITFVSGITVNSLVKIPQSFLWAFLLLGIMGIVLYFFPLNFLTDFLKRLNFSHGNLVILGFCILFFALGIMRSQAADFDVENDPIKKLSNQKETVTLTGQIVEAPNIRPTYQGLKVKIDGTQSVVLVYANLYPTYNYLDKVKITGNLETPDVFDGFNYKNYLLKDGIYSLMTFPKIKLISSSHKYNPFSFLYEKILFARSKLTESIQRTFSFPESTVLDGIVFGNNKQMPSDLKNKFSATGLSHITAVSGGNIVVLVFTLAYVLVFLGFWRGQAFYFSVGFVWFYVALVGFPSSAIRAAIMASIFLLAEKQGRQNTSSRTIVLAGALMLLQNPFLLFYDVGFQLSFLASMGIIHLKPLVDSFFLYVALPLSNYKFKKPLKFSLPKKAGEFLEKRAKNLVDIVAVTLSAQIFTFPIIIYNFGMVSLVAPLTNLLILPMIPVLMALGLLAALFGIFSWYLGWFFALPCKALIIYFLKVLDIFNQPWATKSFENVSWIVFLTYYVVLFLLTIFLKRKVKPRFLGY